MRRLLPLLALLLVAARPAKAPKPDEHGFVEAGRREGFRRWRHAEMKALVDVPPGCSRIEPVNGRGVHYGFAYKHDKLRYEVRLRFEPLAETPAPKKERAACEKADRESPGSCSMADVDAKTTTWTEVIAANVGAPDDLPFLPFPDEGVKREFGADWGYITPPFMLDPKRPWNDGYAVARVATVARRGVGKIHRIVLVDDVERLKDLDSEGFYTARFAGADAPRVPK